MKTTINQLLEELRERVERNISLLRENEAHIRKILAEPLSNQRSENLKTRSDLSKTILAENSDFLLMQNTIIAFQNKYKNPIEYKETLNSINDFESQVRNKFQEINNQISKINEIGISRNELNENSQKEDQPIQQKNSALSEEQIQDSIFRLTVKGEMAFNRDHPYFNDETFFDELLSYHTLREEYEICNNLVRLKN
jgi:hypothetical protein